MMSLPSRPDETFDNDYTRRPALGEWWQGKFDRGLTAMGAFAGRMTVMEQASGIAGLAERMKAAREPDGRAVFGGRQSGA
jgi:hypothetical protein